MHCGEKFIIELWTFKVTWFTRENTQGGASWIPTFVMLLNESGHYSSSQVYVLNHPYKIFYKFIHDYMFRLRQIYVSITQPDDFSCDVKVNIISRWHQAVTFTSDSLRGGPVVNDKQGLELHKHVWLKQGSSIVSIEDFRGSTKTC